MAIRYKPSRFDSLRKFIKEYRRTRLGVIGIGIIIFFVLIALAAPLLSSNNPVTTTDLSGSYSIPAWAKIFPQYTNTPVNTYLISGNGLSTQSTLQGWKITVRPSSTSPPPLNYQVTPSGLLVNFSKAKSSSTVLPIFATSSIPTIVLNQTIAYPWTYTCDFSAGISVIPLSENLTTSQLTIDMYITSVTGRVYHIDSPNVYTNPADVYQHLTSFNKGTTYSITANGKDNLVSSLALASSSGVNVIRTGCGLPQDIFSNPGNITISYVIASSVPSTIMLSNPSIFVQGQAYGNLGTDLLGRDVWAQFLYGARTSLEVGLLAAIVAVLIGTLVGLVAGYSGGWIDEGLMRFNDFVLILPFLPLLLVLLILIDLSNLSTVLNPELVILLLIAFFSWSGIARIIRAQVLSVRERPYVEASRALGAKDRHIIWKHVLPNVMGLVYANMALTVPAAILTEAAVTFLGFGSPSIISWGTMLSSAREAFTSTQHSFVWWYFFPPGIAIALLSMSFIFVGFSLDSVLNPRLRQR